MAPHTGAPRAQRAPRLLRLPRTTCLSRLLGLAMRQSQHIRQTRPPAAPRAGPEAAGAPQARSPAPPPAHGSRSGTFFKSLAGTGKRAHELHAAPITDGRAAAACNVPCPPGCPGGLCNCQIHCSTRFAGCGWLPPLAGTVLQACVHGFRPDSPCIPPARSSPPPGAPRPRKPPALCWAPLHSRRGYGALLSAHGSGERGKASCNRAGPQACRQACEQVGGRHGGRAALRLLTCTCRRRSAVPAAEQTHRPTLTTNTNADPPATAAMVLALGTDRAGDANLIATHSAAASAICARAPGTRPGLACTDSQ